MSTALIITRCINCHESNKKYEQDSLHLTCLSKQQFVDQSRFKPLNGFIASYLERSTAQIHVELVKNENAFTYLATYVATYKTVFDADECE